MSALRYNFHSNISEAMLDLVDPRQSGNEGWTFMVSEFLLIDLKSHGQLAHPAYT